MDNSNHSQRVNPEQSGTTKEAVSYVEMLESLREAIIQVEYFNQNKYQLNYLSKSAKALFNIKSDEICNDPIILWDMVVDDDKPALLASLKEAVNNNHIWKHTFRISSDNNENTWLQGSGTPLDKSDSKVWNILLTDITTLKNESSRTT